MRTYTLPGAERTRVGAAPLLIRDVEVTDGAGLVSLAAREWL